MFPKTIKRQDEHTLLVVWQDSSQTLIPAERLRRHCPCASCREMRGDTSHSKPLGASPNVSRGTGTSTSSDFPVKKSSLLKVIKSELSEETKLARIWAVGNYALGVAWGDGHDSGIYTYALLRELV